MGESEWEAIVASFAAERELRYDRVGGLNPKGEPAALCPGGSNRLTGELADGFWGASCDAAEREEGRWLSKRIVPGAVLVKAHTPDISAVVPVFNVESVEATPDERIRRGLTRRVELESIEFNRRYIATVPREHDPVALRELFSPAFLDWAVGIERECDFGCGEDQLWFMWALRERTREELELALSEAGELFARLHAELREEGRATYPPGPWNAGLEPFPQSSS